MSTMRIDKIINHYISSRMRLRQRAANEKAIETNTKSQDATGEDDLLTLYDVRNVQSRMKAGGNDDNSDENYDYDECVKEQLKKREVKHYCEPCRYANICWTRDRLPHQSLSGERVIVLRNGNACPDYELSRCDPRSNLNPVPAALLSAIEKRKAKEQLAQKLAEKRRLAHERQEKHRTELLKERTEKEAKIVKGPKPKPKPELEKGKGKEKEQPKKQKLTRPNTEKKKRKKITLGRLPAGGECQLCGRGIGNDENGVCTPCSKKIRNIVSNYVNNEKTYDDDSQYDIRSVRSDKGGRMPAQLTDEPSFSVVVLKEQDNNSLVERITDAINRSATALDSTKTNLGWKAPRVEPLQRRVCPSGCSADKRFEFSPPSRASPEFNGGNMRNMHNRNPEPYGGGGGGGGCGGRLTDDDRYCVDDCKQIENRYPRNNMRPCPMMNNFSNNNSLPCANTNFCNNMASCPQASLLNEMPEDECQGAVVSPCLMSRNQLLECTCDCARCKLQNNPIITDLLVKALQIFIEKFQKPVIERRTSELSLRSSSIFNKRKSDSSILSKKQPINFPSTGVRKPPFGKPPQRTAPSKKVQDNKREGLNAKRKEYIPPTLRDNKSRNKRDKKKDKKGKNQKSDKCETTGNSDVITCPCCKVKIRNNGTDCGVVENSVPSCQQSHECPNRKPISNIDMRTMHPRHGGCFSGCPGHRRTENSEPKPQIKGCGCPITSTRYVGGTATENAKQKTLSPISHYRPGVLNRPLSYMVAAGNANRRSLVKTAAGITAYEKKLNVRIRNELGTVNAKNGKNNPPLTNKKSKIT